MSKIAKYFALLGVQPDSTVQEIKKAYRSKAKELHPDVSPHPDAEERFKVLNEAYEMVLALKEGRRSIVYQKVQKRREEARPKTRNAEAQARYEKDRAYREARMRQKREEHARMKETDFYRFMAASEVFLKLIRMSFPFWVSTLGGIFGFVKFGWPGLLFVLVVSAPLWVVVYRYQDEVSGRRLKNSFQQLIRTKYFYKVSTAIAAVLLLFYPWHTVFPWYLYPLLYLLIAGTSLPFWRRWKAHEFSPRFIIAGASPFALNFLFAINYIFSFNPNVQTYEYSLYDTRYDLRELTEDDFATFRQTGNIYLEGSAYDDSFWIRHFFNDQAVMSGKGTVHLTFKQGILGFPVLTEYEFGLLESDQGQKTTPEGKSEDSYLSWLKDQ